ncbi:hypothetical protein Y1Q_0019862 [Alligator mississippiensis]|uniref:Uncharacterized protein n=1 Tax=Alligator mississippiensis TaxID=8496 RepID=A0A151PFU1_ALLMI|nr:hypothetical protein Y1Q_0019862 [Alligator mississippiensis]
MGDWLHLANPPSPLPGSCTRSSCSSEMLPGITTWISSIPRCIEQDLIHEDADIQNDWLLALTLESNDH